MIGDIDDNGMADIVRYQTEMVLQGNGNRPHRFRTRTQVSWDGRSAWVLLLERTYDVPLVNSEDSFPVHVGYIGKFRGAGTELLEVSGIDRKGRVFDVETLNVVDHSKYSY